MIRAKRIATVLGSVLLFGLEGKLPAVGGEETAGAAAVSEAAGLAAVEVPHTAFADSELRLRFACHEPSRVAWQASAARRPLSGGVVEARKGRVEIVFRTPHVKDGVVLPIQVAVGDRSHKIFVFPKDPLAGRRRWAEQSKVVLFDPVGRTAEALDEIELPYRRLTGLGPLAAAGQGTIVVGEGVPLGEHRGLDRVLCDLARRGRPVLLLAPESGRLAIGDPPPARFELRGADAAGRIDARTAGVLTGGIVYRVSGERNEPMLEVARAASGYAWGDFRFEERSGRLCCVGWKLVESWERSPAGRYFFVRLLELVSGGEDLPGGKKND